ncbi:MAG: hypothetical protein QM636_26355 [Rhizobium sp.]
MKSRHKFRPGLPEPLRISKAIRASAGGDMPHDSADFPAISVFWVPAARFARHYDKVVIFAWTTTRFAAPAISAGGTARDLLERAAHRRMCTFCSISGPFLLPFRAESLH